MSSFKFMDENYEEDFKSNYKGFQDEVNQVLTTNLWLEMQWFDYRLMWDPGRWGKIRKLHVPVDQIWIPDILLYNNADGEPHITIMSDAIVYYNGLVTTGCEVVNKADDEGEFQFLGRGMDLSGYYPSLEWDLMELNSARHEKIYAGCCGQDFYIDITFKIEIRRKTLFYTVNLMIPCMMFAILTSIVFYVPPIEHKMTFSISILVTLTVFYLILIDLVPPTSLVIPLIGKYLLFTMFLVSISIMLSVISLNFYRRDGSSFPMPHWMKVVFIHTLPKYICIKTADEDDGSDRGSSISDIGPFMDSRRPSPFFITVNERQLNGRLSELKKKGMHPDLIRNMIQNVEFIAEYFNSLKKEDKISEDWSYVANVIDRIFLIIFSIMNVVGTWVILINSPAMFDNRTPLAINSVARPLSGDTFEHFINENFTQIAWWARTIQNSTAELSDSELCPILYQ
ncbi:Protein CBR-ACR-8 [Caenorhabditis briggsae]|uniref:Protein CBR-ACR-8 n=1 Tax=Caenorhabditis briggsae TaxID=6238 RepID=A8XQI4_CAEBR|nr:Protein CBR-ACR-8 [Caenorhabditis briggsae]CAP34909.2 Protein CBR-ACR-8 [Caenorhabditis briggsae]